MFLAGTSTNVLSKEGRAQVIIIYPHFFNNTRTLINTVDNILADTMIENVFIYLSNEYSPSFFYTLEEASYLRQNLAMLSGNLAPDFNFDIKKIISDSHYKMMTDSIPPDQLDYHFFIPDTYWQYIDKQSSSPHQLIYELGIIPKTIIQNKTFNNPNIYFPETDNRKRNIEADINIRIKEI